MGILIYIMNFTEVEITKIKKIFSRIERFFIYRIDGINSKLYMQLYNRWLKKEGMQLNESAKYIHHTVQLDGIDYKKIYIGKNVVISRDTLILIHDFSIEAGLVALKKGNKNNEARFIKDVFIGDDSFIGARCVILPGTHIGKNCIVGAGSILTSKRYPDYSIIVGNPAKVVGDVREWTKKKIDEDEITYGCII